MERKMYTTALLLAFSIAGIFSAATAEKTKPSSDQPIKVVVVSGSNYEMGVQYGEQAADLIAQNKTVVWNLLDEQVVDANGAPLGRDVVRQDLKVWQYYLEKYDPQLKEWLQGISKGCKKKDVDISYMDLLAILAFPGEIWSRPADDYPEETGIKASVGGGKKDSEGTVKTGTGYHRRSSCSAYAATRSATFDGNAMVSITGAAFLEVTNYVILVAYPDNGERFIALTYAGRVANNGGMNSSYTWVMPAAVNAPWMPCASHWGVTAEVYFHYLLQYCKSPAEAENFLNATPKGNVTGLFVFADKSKDVSVYEGGYCAATIRKPGDLGESDFVVSTNNYNDPSMVQYNLGADYFPDTYVRYITIFKKLALAGSGAVGLDYAKNMWLSNDWFDETANQWQTVPVPNDTSDPNIYNVPGNLGEGGEYQMIQFPTQNTTYLQLGVPQGTSIQYSWPENPKPTGEYTKWLLCDSISGTSSAASADAHTMIEAATASFAQKSSSLDSLTRSSLSTLLTQATTAWSEGKKLEDKLNHNRNCHKEQMDKWGSVYTNYSTAQLDAQMVSTKLKAY
jgi:hypothetical protein